MKTVWIMLTLMAALACAPADAAFPEPAPNAQLAEIKKQIENGHAAIALGRLKQLLKDTQEEADMLNLMGYACRKYEQARKHYTRALTLDPRHKGALEYMRELELETGHRGAARALLIRLRAVCPEGCEELDDLVETFDERNIARE